MKERKKQQKKSQEKDGKKASRKDGMKHKKKEREKQRKLKTYRLQHGNLAPPHVHRRVSHVDVGNTTHNQAETTVELRVSFTVRVDAVDVVGSVQGPQHSLHLHTHRERRW